MEKDFDRWNRIKKITDASDEAARLYFREGEVWWVRLGKNIGYETDGKSREFTRPVIVLKKYNQYSFLPFPSQPRRSPILTVSRSAWCTASRRSQHFPSYATSTASASSRRSPISTLRYSPP
jgi:hypothetical protein